MRLKDKIIIVTGAAGGLGRNFSVRLAKEGAKVVAADISDVSETIHLVKAAGGDCIGSHVDITKFDSTERMAKAAYEEFGGLHGLVNNAAAYAGLTMCPFYEIPEADWDKAFSVNIKGVWHCCKAVLPYMKKSGGSIVNLSSASILEGNPFFAHYVASKGAVWSFTRSIARNLGEFSIRANSITPGYTMTQSSKDLAKDPEEFEKNYKDNINARALKRAMMPEDVEGAVVFLLSDDSAFITGQNINVDGGRVHY